MLGLSTCLVIVEMLVVPLILLVTMLQLGLLVMLCDFHGVDTSEFLLTQTFLYL